MGTIEASGCESTASQGQCEEEWETGRLDVQKKMFKIHLSHLHIVLLLVGYISKLCIVLY